MAETVTAFLEHVQEAAQVLEEPELNDLIAAAQEHASVSTLRILILGATGSGRFSLANALLGQHRLLPASPVPKVPIPLEVSYGDAPQASLVSKGGSTTALPLDQLRSFLTNPDTRANDYLRVEVQAVSDLLKTSRFRIENSGAARSPAAWKEVLAGADYIFLTLKAVALLSEEERRFIEEVLHPTFGLERVTIVINQIDLIEPEERPALNERVRAFLGPFERQPAIIEFSTLQLSQGAGDDALDSGYEAMIRIARSDLLDHHQVLRATALRQGAELCLAALEEVTARQQALASTSEAELNSLLEKIDTRQKWLPARVERVQHRVETFINTILREQFMREIEGFSAALQEQLPGEIMPEQDITRIRRYLAGYIEALWKEFFIAQQDAVRSKLAAEVKQINQMIEDDFRELLEEQAAHLQSGSDGFDPSPDRLSTLLMPRRGKHQLGGIATGIQVFGLIFLVANLPLGLAAIGIGQVIRILFKKDMETADKQAILTSAGNALRELEVQIKKQVARRFDEINAETKQAVAERYEQGLTQIRSVLEESLAWRHRLDEKQAQLTSLQNEIIPQLRALLSQLQGTEGAA